MNYSSSSTPNTSSATATTSRTATTDNSVASSAQSQVLRDDVKSIVASAMASLETLKATREQIMRRGEEASHGGSSAKKTQPHRVAAGAPDRHHKSAVPLDDVIPSPRRHHDAHHDDHGDGKSPKGRSTVVSSNGHATKKKPQTRRDNARFYQESETEVSMVDDDHDDEEEDRYQQRRHTAAVKEGRNVSFSQDEDVIEYARRHHRDGHHTRGGTTVAATKQYGTPRYDDGSASDATTVTSSAVDTEEEEEYRYRRAREEQRRRRRATEEEEEAAIAAAEEEARRRRHKLQGRPATASPTTASGGRSAAHTSSSRRVEEEVSYSSEFGKRFGVQPSDLRAGGGRTPTLSGKGSQQQQKGNAIASSSHQRYSTPQTAAFSSSRYHHQQQHHDARRREGSGGRGGGDYRGSAPSTVNQSTASSNTTADTMQHYGSEDNSRRKPSSAAAATASSVDRELVVVALKKELEASQAEAAELSNRLKAVTTELSMQQVGAKQREMDSDTAMAGLRVAHQKELTTLMADLTNAKHKGINDATETLRRQYEAEAEKLNAELATAKAQQGDLSRRFQQYKKDHGAQKERIAGYEALVAQLNKDLEGKQKRIDDLSRAAKDSKHFRKVAEEQLLTKAHEAELEVQKHAALEAQLADVSNQLRASEDSNRAFEEQASDELRRLTRLFEEARVAHEERLTEAIQRGDKCDKLKAKVKELKQQAAEESTAMQAVKQQLAKALDDVARMEQAFANATAQHEEERSSLQQALQLEREGYQSFLKQTDDTLAAVHQEYSDKFEMLKTQCEKLDLALQHCQRELEEERGERAAAERSASDLELQLESMVERQRLTEVLAKEKFDTYKQHTNETIDSLKKQIVDRDKRSEQLAVMSSGSSETIQRLRDQLASERAKNATLEAQMREVKGLAKRVGDNLQREVRRTEIRNIASSSSASPPSIGGSTPASYAIHHNGYSSQQASILDVSSPRPIAPPPHHHHHHTGTVSTSYATPPIPTPTAAGPTSDGLIASAARALQKASGQVYVVGTAATVVNYSGSSAAAHSSHHLANLSNASSSAAPLIGGVPPTHVADKATAGSGGVGGGVFAPSVISAVMTTPQKAGPPPRESDGATSDSDVGAMEETTAYRNPATNTINQYADAPGPAVPPPPASATKARAPTVAPSDEDHHHHHQHLHGDGGGPSINIPSGGVAHQRMHQQQQQQHHGIVATPAPSSVNTSSILHQRHDQQMSRFREQTNTLYQQLTQGADDAFKQRCLDSVRNIDYTAGAGGVASRRGVAAPIAATGSSSDDGSSSSS